MALPDASFLEGADGNAHRVVKRYGGAVVDHGGIETPSAPRWLTPHHGQNGLPHPANAIRAAADAISSAAGAQPVVCPREVCILIRTAGALPHLPGWATAIDPLTSTGPSVPVALVDTPPQGLSPQAVVDQGTELLVSTGPPAASLLRWLRMAPARPALPVVGDGAVTVGPHHPPDRVLHALARTIADPTDRAVVLDLRRIDAPRTNRTLDSVPRWIAGQPVVTVPATRLLTDTATRLLHGGTP